VYFVRSLKFGCLTVFAFIVKATFAFFCLPAEPAVIVPGCRLMPHNLEPIPASYNQIFRPMMAEFYNYYYQNYLESHAHSQAKNRWLWNAFIKVYLPDLSNISNYILMFKTAEEIASDQQKAVEKYHQEVWQYWLKWCKYMMYPGIPGELVFASDYRNQGGSPCPKVLRRPDCHSARCQLRHSCAQSRTRANLSLSERSHQQTP
jgi:hypothetical protein